MLAVRNEVPFLPFQPSYQTSFPSLHSYISQQKIESSNNVWERFKAAFQKKSANYYKIIASTPLEANDLITAFSSHEFWILRPYLRIHIEKLSLEQKSALFTQVTQHAVETCQLVTLERVSSFVTEDEIIDILKNLNAHVTKDEIDLLRRSLKEVYEKELVKEKQLHQLGKKSTLHYLYRFFDTLLAAFSFFKFGHVPTSPWEASFLLTFYLQLFALPFVMAGLIGTMATIGVLGGLFLSLWYYATKIKKAPQELPLCQNLTSLARQGKLEKFQGRVEELEQLKTLLNSSNQFAKLHPLLIGPTGVGKTSLWSQLAQEVVKGNIPENLKNLEIFALNAAKLLTLGSNTSPSDLIKIILDMIGYEKEKVLICFDEVHAGMQTPLKDLLKSVFDSSPGSLSYVSGATTSEDYNKHVEPDKAMVSRFQNIPLKSLSQEIIIPILREVAFKIAPELEFDNAFFTKIYELTKERAQPAVAKKVLSVAITLFYQQEQSLKTFKAYKDKIEEIENLEFSLQQKPSIATAKALEASKEALYNLQKNYEIEKQQLEKTIALRKFYLFSKQALTAYSLTQKTNALLFTYGYLLPSLKQKIKFPNDESHIQEALKLI